MNFSTRAMTLAATAIAGVVISVAAIAEGGEGPTGPPGSQTPAAAPPGAEQPAEAVDKGVAAVVAPFRRTRSSNDAMPAQVAAYLDWARSRGANADLARQAFSKSGQTVYLLPGNGAVCLVITGAAGGAIGPSCRTPDQLSSSSGGPGVLGLDCSGGTSTELPACDGTRLFGIAADQVDQVTVALESGDSVSSTVVNNAYLIDVPGPRPREIRLVGRGRVITQRVP